jgi:hypothetical protein
MKHRSGGCTAIVDPTLILFWTAEFVSIVAEHFAPFTERLLTMEPITA